MGETCTLWSNSEHRQSKCHSLSLKTREVCRAGTFCRRALSERVATYNQRVVGEGDSLAEEVSSMTDAAAKVLVLQTKALN